ncbi:uncharacterized protein MONBRDRAFT_11535 [Monosiga brevicollis MX1]|uniref:Uncharacterized protein n=1 Tax=Monosiga brevicollis TaxID=81824 RepID=A9V9F5_MONBE|nr:uncharacterized protein MONBRDRAFT_11535 [Monosiga brevicollis MX1]EDQ85852.1 predicted protein [Monosiga brevicollis MX1]|eukprot:XP_001749331.1 hypothetical protein [Monosiga brevicollis MX1]
MTVTLNGHLNVQRVQVRPTSDERVIIFEPQLDLLQIVQGHETQTLELPLNLVDVVVAEDAAFLIYENAFGYLKHYSSATSLTPLPASVQGPVLAAYARNNHFLSLWTRNAIIECEWHAVTSTFTVSNLTSLTWTPKHFSLHIPNRPLAHGQFHEGETTIAQPRLFFIAQRHWKP